MYCRLSVIIQLETPEGRGKTVTLNTKRESVDRSDRIGDIEDKLDVEVKKWSEANPQIDKLIRGKASIDIWR